jgi:hypothetical protein
VKIDLSGFFSNTADWLEANPHDYASLANGPLGEALTRSELEALAGDDEAIAEIVKQCREQS